MIYLETLSELIGCEMYGKAEFQNPGGSVKDRTAVSIIQDAEKKGRIKPGGTVVEGTEATLVSALPMFVEPGATSV